jgi:hypothetical protein
MKRTLVHMAVLAVMGARIQHPHGVYTFGPITPPPRGVVWGWTHAHG